MPCAVFACWIGFDPDTSTSILPHHQHPQQRKHRPDSPQRVCHKRDSKRKNGDIFRFWHDAVLVFSRRSFPAAMLDHHSPPVGRAISVCRRKRRQIAICGRFPDPVRCVLLQRLVRQQARFSRRAEDESNGFLRLAATGWALRPGFSQSRQCPCG